MAIAYSPLLVLFHVFGEPMSYMSCFDDCKSVLTCKMLFVIIYSLGYLFIYLLIFIYVSLNLEWA